MWYNPLVKLFITIEGRKKPMGLSKQQKRQVKKLKKQAVNRVEDVTRDVKGKLPESIPGVKKKRSSWTTVGQVSAVGVVGILVSFVLFFATLTIATIVNSINEEDQPSE